jgi:sulfur-carrier protein
MLVNFYGTYRLTTGQKSIHLEIPQGGTLLDLLHAVTARFPVLQKELFDESGNLFPHIPLYLDGRNPRLLALGLATVVQPQNVLSIFSPISSGRINVEDVHHLQSDE